LTVWQSAVIIHTYFNNTGTEMFEIETLDAADGTEAYDQAEEMIEAQGATTYLGSGLYGRVFGSPDNDVVYKISHVCDNDGYIAYVKTLAQQKTHNPYTPKIYGVRFIVSKQNEVMVVAMEKLAPLTKAEDNIPYWFSDTLHRRNFHDVMTEPTVRARLGITNRTLPKPLSEAIKVLKASKSKCNKSIGWDLHKGNFMLRGQQIVCTDPLA